MKTLLLLLAACGYVHDVSHGVSVGDDGSVQIIKVQPADIVQQITIDPPPVTQQVTVDPPAIVQDVTITPPEMEVEVRIQPRVQVAQTATDICRCVNCTCNNTVSTVAAPPQIVTQCVPQVQTQCMPQVVQQVQTFAEPQCVQCVQPQMQVVQQVQPQCVNGMCYEQLGQMSTVHAPIPATGERGRVRYSPTSIAAQPDSNVQTHRIVQLGMINRMSPGSVDADNDEPRRRGFLARWRARRNGF